MEQYIIPPNYEPHAMVVPFAKVIKEQVTKCPVIVVNSLTPETAEKALEDQCADIIAMGRPLIADPELPKKLIEGRREDIRPCCRGHEGCVSLFFSGCPIRCEVNPQCGREKELKLVKTNNPQNVVIVGGGVAGMEAARYGCEVGDNITLIEKEAFKNCINLNKIILPNELVEVKESAFEGCVSLEQLKLTIFAVETVRA